MRCGRRSFRYPASRRPSTGPEVKAAQLAVQNGQLKPKLDGQQGQHMTDSDRPSPLAGSRCVAVRHCRKLRRCPISSTVPLLLTLIAYPPMASTSGRCRSECGTRRAGSTGTGGWTCRLWNMAAIHQAAKLTASRMHSLPSRPPLRRRPRRSRQIPWMKRISGERKRRRMSDAANSINGSAALLVSRGSRLSRPHAKPTAALTIISWVTQRES